MWASSRGKLKKNKMTAQTISHHLDRMRSDNGMTGREKKLEIAGR
jgi:hypothetical protein